MDRRRKGGFVTGYGVMKRLFALISRVFLGLLSVFGLGCRKPPAVDVRIPVSMKKYVITPGLIRVKSGQQVELDVTTADVQHGLDIPALSIKQPVQPGHTTTIYFTAPAKGEYPMTCGVICGPHHDDMTGKLVVE
jgi:cytochrome c oxidase subunit 2